MAQRVRAVDDASKSDDADQIVEASEVPGVAGVEPGAVRVRGGSDEQVHDATPGLTSRFNDGGRDPAVADRHCFVDWQRVKVLLQNTQSSQSLGSKVRRLGHENAEVKLSQRDRADREHPRNGCDAVRADDAGVKDGAFRHVDPFRHRATQGS